MVRIAGMLLLLAFMTSPWAAEDYTQWSYYRPISVNTKSSGLSGTVKKIPILIRLTSLDTVVFNHAQSGGQDIRFSKNDSVARPIPYQIERWDATNKLAEIWVLPDSIKAGDSIAYLRMFWGNAAAADSQKASAVFDVANGFIGVWHLAESPVAGTANFIKDATANGLNATAKGTMAAVDLVPGIIGNAHHFNGTDAGDSIAFAAALNSPNGVTLSAWINPASFNPYSRIISHDMPRDSMPYTVYCLNTADSAVPRFRGEVSSDTQFNVQGKGDIKTLLNTWYYVSFTYDKTALKMFRNGVQDSISIAGVIPIKTTQTTPLMIGKSNHGTNLFNGIIDEPTVAKVARSADWIKLCYMNQMAKSTTVGLGAAVLQLTVIAPSISAQPPTAVWAGVKNVTTKIGLKATGTSPTYQWTKNGVAVGANNGKDTLALDTVKRADNLAVYKCTISNTAGSVPSAACTLHVVAAVFGAKPTTGNNDTLTVAFTDSSTGSAAAVPLTWNWSFGDGQSSTVGNPPPHFYAKPNTYPAKLIVTANGIMDSSTIKITVNALPLIAGFKPDTTTAPLSLTVTFTDTSKGTVFNRVWNFGDGTIVLDTGKRTPISHTYTKIGSDTVTLTVNGPAGTSTKIWPDCILIVDPNGADNPIRLSGRYQSANSVSVTFSGYDNLKDAAPPPYVQSIELWGKKNTLPSDTVTADKLGGYSLATLKAAGSLYATTSTLTGTYLSTDSVGLMAVIVWNSGVRSAFAGRNATYVSMKDTAKPLNPLVISAAYIGDSTVNIFLDSVQAIDTVKTPFVKVEYDLIDSINFSNNPLPDLPSRTVVSQAVGARYTLTVHDTRFMGSAHQVYCAVSLKNRNQVYSARKTAAITVGMLRPINLIVLNALTVSSQSIELSWPPVTGVDSIRVWYSNQKPVPLTYDIPDGFTPLYAPLTATTLLVGGLEPNMRYFFGAQVAQNGIWSYVTATATTIGFTDTSSDTTRIRNTIAIDTVFFDTVSNNITVIWRIDTTGHYNDTLDAGASFSTDSSAIDTGGPTIRKQNIKPLDTISVVLGEKILFNTKYYIGLWLRKQGALWSKPVDSSKTSLQMPGFVWQSVKYGVGYPVAYADNGIFRIRIDSATPYPTGVDANKIRRWTPPQTPPGFVPLSIGFEFGVKIRSASLNIGIKFDAPPAGFSASDVRMYRYDSLWRVDRSPLIYDNANGYVSVFTNNIDHPFIAMIDTMHPNIDTLNPIGSYVPAGQDIADSFSISDNIANLTWRFQYAAGGLAYDPSQDTGTFNAYADTLSTLIQAGSVSADQGVRAILIVNDGLHQDTFNVSRRVSSDNGLDVVSTNPLKWVPLRVTGFLDKPRVPYALKALCADSVWKYDITKFRLFRWYPYAGNATKPDSAKWVEYADFTDSLFSFLPGRVEWVKTRKAATIDFGKSVTPDLKRPQSLVLKPNTWSDIALPYHFDIKVGDIKEATADSSGAFESLHFVGWHRFNDTGDYISEEVYYPSIGVGDPTTPLSTFQKNRQFVVYSVYNPSPKPFPLTIPPIPVAMSKYAVNHAQKHGAMPWVFKVTGWTAGQAARAEVYCAFKEGSPDKRYYPAAPSMSDNAAVRFCNEENGRFGYVISSGSFSKEGGIAFTMALSAASGHAGQVYYSIEPVNGLPLNMRAVILDPETGTLENAADALSAGAEAGGSVVRQLIIGNESYIARARASAPGLKLALVGAYPNPFKRSMRIRFTIPPTGLGEVKFGIFNPSGREVWNTSVACGGRSGPHEIIWNGKSKSKGPSASGMYIVRMVALHVNGSVAGVFEKKIMYLQ